MRTLCYSVRLSGLADISDKAYKATAFDGSTAIIPKSQVIGHDYEVGKSDAYWISAWILEKKNLQYSMKKKAWIDSDTGKVFPVITVERHIPQRKEPVNVEPNARLIR